MKRTYTIMTGNLGKGFEDTFAREYRKRLSDAYWIEIQEGRMQPIDVVLKDGSGSVPRGGWESDPDEDVIREIADHVYNELVSEFNSGWGEEPDPCDWLDDEVEDDRDDNPRYEVCLDDPREDIYRDIEQMSEVERVDAEIAHENLPVQVLSFDK